MYILITINNKSNIPVVLIYDNLAKALLKQDQLSLTGCFSHLYDVVNDKAIYLRGI